MPAGSFDAHLPVATLIFKRMTRPTFPASLRSASFSELRQAAQRGDTSAAVERLAQQIKQDVMSAAPADEAKLSVDSKSAVESKSAGLHVLDQSLSAEQQQVLARIAFNARLLQSLGNQLVAVEPPDVVMDAKFESNRVSSLCFLPLACLPAFAAHAQAFDQLFGVDVEELQSVRGPDIIFALK